MPEYWWSARKACLQLLGGQQNTTLPNEIPQKFYQLRPWVHQGWEMVLLASELLRTESPLNTQGVKFFSANYHSLCHQALKAWGWEPTQLQKSLEDVRQWAIKHDRENWLARHKPFPHVVRWLNQLNNEGIEWAVLTTKGRDFAAELLHSFHLKPNLLYGHESGSKTKMLLHLQKNRIIEGFIEDRRVTLETVLNTPALSSIKCYLASWGYLKPEDKIALPKGIQLLQPENLTTPLASWS